MKDVVKHVRCGVTFLRVQFDWKFERFPCQTGQFPSLKDFFRPKKKAEWKVLKKKMHALI